MAPETAPPGKTFEERWPDDASSADYLAGPWIPVALGGLAGLLGLPILLWAAARTNPVPFLVVVGGTILVMTVLAMRLGRKGRRRALSVWKIAGWALVAAVGGLVVTVLSDAICDVACQATAVGQGISVLPSVLIMAASIIVSVGVAVGVDRAARRVPTRGSASVR